MVSPISSGGCSSCSAREPIDQQVSLAVAVKRRDAAKQQGQAIEQLLEQAVKLASAPDKGQSLDLVA